MEMDDNEAVSLDKERTKKFLNLIAEDPFLTIVVTGDGEVRIFAKDLEPEHVERIKDVLEDLRDG